MDCKPLAKLNVGDRGRVTQILAGRSATKRLYEMGFNTGARVEVLKNDRGPMIVGLGGHKIALGRGLAEKMLIGLK
ncbi:MAG: ferrous iron transport protein A [Firmicutes bacterium]|jgi:ferrous iron transport protein A|nr:ferrous iron transport protein A [Bacillota bacterium]